MTLDIPYEDLVELSGEGSNDGKEKEKEPHRHLHSHQVGADGQVHI